MTITYPLDVPLQDFAEFDVDYVDATSIQVSPYTLRESVQSFDGDYWRGTLAWSNLDRELAQPVLRFLAALRGVAGTFVMAYPGYTLPLGTASTIAATPLVDGAGQAGARTLSIKSAPVSETGWLLDGDIIQVGPISRPHWHIVLGNVDTTAGGLATADIWPAVRNGVTDNDQIVTSSPNGLFRLIGRPKISVRPPLLYTITMDVRESTG